MMKRLFTLLAAAPLILGGMTGAARGTTTTMDCGALAATHVAGATTAAPVADGYCQVQGVLTPNTHFTVKLPMTGWTGEYVQQGCSGFCGEVPDLSYPLFGFSCPAALAHTLVVAADDTGHTGTPESAEPATWGADPRARLAFGLLSEPRLKLASDALMTAYYGHGPA